MAIAFLALVALALAPTASALGIRAIQREVNTSADSGPGSLRDMILLTNAYPGLEMVRLVYFVQRK